MGRFEDGDDRGHARRGDTASYLSRATSTSWPRPRAPTSPGCRSCFEHTTASSFDDIDVFYLAGGFGRHLQRRGGAAHRPDPDICRTRRSSRSATPRSRARRMALLSRAKRARARGDWSRRVEHCRLETHPGFFDFFVDGCQFKPVQTRRRRVSLEQLARARMRISGASIDARAGVDVRSGRVHAAARLSARPRARRARARARRLRREAWYATHGRPWIYAREAGDARRSTTTASRIDGVPFASPRLRADAARRRRRTRAMLVAVSAGPELEAEAQRALARREAGRVLLPRGLRLGGRRAPGDA